MYRHIVLFRMHDDVSDQQVTEAIARLRSLAVLPGIIRWNVELSLDIRKGRLIIEDATFTDEAAFARFRRHPTHVEAGRAMSTISDWWSGDYFEQHDEWSAEPEPR